MYISVYFLVVWLLFCMFSLFNYFYVKILFFKIFLINNVFVLGKLQMCLLRLYIDYI